MSPLITTMGVGGGFGSVNVQIVASWSRSRGQAKGSRGGLRSSFADVEAESSLCDCLSLLAEVGYSWPARTPFLLIANSFPC